MSFKDFATAFVKRNDNKIHFQRMGKGEAVNLLGNTDLTKKTGTLPNTKTLLLSINMGNEIIQFSDSKK